MKTIILASNNSGKINELNELLKNFDIVVKSLKDFNINEEPIENGKTFEENALIKARFAFEKTGSPSLADDSGFCINSLNNFPGLYSARFAEAIGGYENTFKILNDCIKNTDKLCHFVCCIAFVYKNISNKLVEKTFNGAIYGEFIYPPRGTSGFGFDSIFVPKNYNKTFAEIPEIKFKISHRKKAIEKFVDFLRKIND